MPKGGNGGFGNAYFKSSVNQAPRKANPGQAGEEFNLIFNKANYLFGDIFSETTVYSQKIFRFVLRGKLYLQGMSSYFYF